MKNDRQFLVTPNITRVELKAKSFATTITMKPWKESKFLWWNMGFDESCGKYYTGYNYLHGVNYDPKKHVIEEIDEALDKCYYKDRVIVSLADGSSETKYFESFKDAEQFYNVIKTKCAPDIEEYRDDNPQA